MTQVPSQRQIREARWRAARAHALTAATMHGLPVIPLAMTKLPAVPAAHPGTADAGCTGQCGRPGHGIHDASSDPDRVYELFAAAPWATGYGIACGRAPYFLFGLDLDRKNGVDGVAALRRLAIEHRFTVPRTVTVVTQSGGLHLWLTAPAGARVPNTAGALGPGIDTRGAGGYLVGHGSLGSRGKYRMVTNFSQTPPAPTPAAIMDLLNGRLTAVQDSPGRRGPGGGFRPAEGRLGALVRFVLDCGPNDLNNRLYWASRRAFEQPDIDPETATARLLDAAVRRGHPEVPARRTILSARRGAARKEASA